MNIRQRLLQLLLPAVIGLAVTGAWISGELLRIDMGGTDAAGARTGLFAKMCKAAGPAGFTCGGLHESRWAKVRVPVPVPTRDLTLSVRMIGVPVAFLGLGYFASLVVWFVLLGRPCSSGRYWDRLPLHGAIGAAAVSLFYLALMTLGAASRCAGCLVIHAINGLLLAAIHRLYANGSRESAVTVSDESSLSWKQLAVRLLPPREIAGVIGVCVVLVAGAGFYVRERLAFRDRMNWLAGYKTLVESLQENPAFLLREHYAQARHEIPLRSDETPQNMPRLVVFTDYECPSCYCNSLSIQHSIAKAFEGRLAVSVRHFPLCNDCNSTVKNIAHTNACQAARAAEAARLQGGENSFWRMHELLFEHRKDLGRVSYRDLAVRIGLDADRFVEDMQSPAVHSIVDGDVVLARRLGVTGTPTMFLDGRQVAGLCLTPLFWKTVAQAASPPGGAHRLAAGDPANEVER
jgi:predicted DsbA family dithiol-disulfide isomerase